jgi:hypothetical protein
MNADTHGRPGGHARQPGQDPLTRPAQLTGGQHPDRELAIWGAHGGAGTTTLASWLQPSRDLGAMRQEPGPACPASIAARRGLVITCRNTAWSATRAMTAVAAVTQRGGHVAVLAVMSDGWPEPASATARFDLLEDRVGAVIRVPFVAGLRPADDPAAVALPRRALRALAQIAAVAGRGFPIR